MVVRPLSLSASMTRWKPSVSSRSGSVAVSGLAVLTAASAMGRLPRFYASCSIEMIGVAGDVLGEAERVIAHQILVALGVARLDRLDDVHMVADRPIGTVFLADRLAADH